jgi:hypothetical protein
LATTGFHLDVKFVNRHYGFSHQPILDTVMAMMRLLGVFSVLALVVASAARAETPVAADPIQVIVLGTYHFGNPGLDQHNMTADDVRTPRRQAELAAVARALAEFHPTHVMVEMQFDTPDLAVSAYQRFEPADLAGERNEIVQIAFRLAHVAHLRTVEGIDEREGAGKPDYFPINEVRAYANAHGQGDIVAHADAKVERFVRSFAERQRTATVAELLTLMNDPAQLRDEDESYYDLLRIGDHHSHPGAELNAYWYMRNAKIFAKLMTVAHPGDRIIVIFGSGHGFWLRHFARETPGFIFVDPRPFLLRAGRN